MNGSQEWNANGCNLDREKDCCPASNNKITQFFSFILFLQSLVIWDLEEASIIATKSAVIWEWRHYGWVFHSYGVTDGILSNYLSTEKSGLLSFNRELPFRPKSFDKLLFMGHLIFCFLLRPAKVLFAQTVGLSLRGLEFKASILNPFSLKWRVSVRECVSKRERERRERTSVQMRVCVRSWEVLLQIANR